MIKINKQVAKSKISCFLEGYQVVLFFHCNNNICLHKNDTFIHLNNFQVANSAFNSAFNSAKLSSSWSSSSSRQTRKKRATTLSGAFLNEPLTPEKNVKDNCETYKKQIFTNQNTLKSMMVKNRLAKRVFLDLNTVKSLYSQNEGLILKKRASYIASLFQGPTLLLGCSDIEILKKGIDFSAKYRELILLGAFFEKTIINHSQVERLIALSNNEQGYLNLLSSMKNSFLRPLSLIRYLVSMRCIFAQQNRLIRLLKMRKQQILIANT